MADLYLYDDVPVLRNSLGIKDENTLDRIEAEQSRANMMLLYERGFHDFTPSGLCEIHHFLFGDLYDWAGKYRIINSENRVAVFGIAMMRKFPMIWKVHFPHYTSRIGIV